MTESLVHVPSTNMEEAGFITYTAASKSGFTLWSHHVVHLYINDQYVSIIVGIWAG